MYGKICATINDLARGMCSFLNGGNLILLMSLLIFGFLLYLKWVFFVSIRQFERSFCFFIYYLFYIIIGLFFS